VVIAIVAVLVGLSVVGLSAARRAASQTKSLSNLRGIGQSIEVYCGTYRSYPFAPAETLLDAMPPGEANAEQVGFSPVWLLEYAWPMLMHPVAPWDQHYATWISPGLQRPASRPWVRDPGVFFDTGAKPSYRYSNSFLARPAVWARDIEAGSAAIGPTTPADVAMPSLKVLMFDIDRAYLRANEGGAPRPLLFADSSAAARQDSDAHAPVQNRLHGNPPLRYHDTPDGILGRDF